MYGDFILLEDDRSAPVKAQKLALGETAGRSEAWLRDTLFDHPEILPISDIDPAFNALTPLCTELRTEAGPLDIAFINPVGRLVLVECKLWRNPEARRKVVAQVLDYARAIQSWSYADLQRQVSAARNGKGQGNLPFELVKKNHPEILEHRFIDQAQLAMRSGRFLLIIAGDGIREDVDAMAQLINRNAASGFSFGLVEVALYDLNDRGLLVQPRVIAKTKTIERTVIVVRDPKTNELQSQGEDNQILTKIEEEFSKASNDQLGENPKQIEYRKWWKPVLEMRFDDPEQEPPQLFYPNNVRIALPWPNMWILMFWMASGRTGVCTASRKGVDQPVLKALDSQRDEILAELPEYAELVKFDSYDEYTYKTERRRDEFNSEEENKAWLMDCANKYVNAFRPRVLRLMESQNKD
jgi:hypothetical protein